jgi:hypothetical protein
MSIKSIEGSNPNHMVVVKSWFSLPGGLEFSGNPGPLAGIKRNVFAEITWRQ